MWRQQTQQQCEGINELIPHFQLCGWKNAFRMMMMWWGLCRSLGRRWWWWWCCCWGQQGEMADSSIAYFWCITNWWMSCCEIWWNSQFRNSMIFTCYIWNFHRVLSICLVCVCIIFHVRNVFKSKNSENSKLQMNGIFTFTARMQINSWLRSIDDDQRSHNR